MDNNKNNKIRNPVKSTDDPRTAATDDSETINQILLEKYNPITLEDDPGTAEKIPVQSKDDPITLADDPTEPTPNPLTLIDNPIIDPPFHLLDQYIEHQMIIFLVVIFLIMLGLSWLLQSHLRKQGWL